MDKQVWDLRENVRYLSILLLVVLYIISPSAMTFTLLAYWVFILLVMGNIRRLPYNNRLAYFFRMTLYFLPFSIPFILFAQRDIMPDPLILNAPLILFCFVAVVVFLVWLCINWKSIRLSLSDEMIAEAPKESKFVFSLRAYTTIGAAVCEELFFRSFILSIDAPIYLIMPVSVLCFMLSHYLLPWGNRAFSNKDHFYQIVFGVVSGFLFLASGSVVPSILLHLLLNTPTILMIVRRYERHYVRKGYFDGLVERNKQVIEDLEI